MCAACVCSIEASPQPLQSHHLPRHCTATPPSPAVASPAVSGPAYPTPYHAPSAVASSTIKQLVQAFVQNLMQVRTSLLNWRRVTETVACRWQTCGQQRALLTGHDCVAAIGSSCPPLRS